MVSMLSALAIALTSMGVSSDAMEWQADYGKALAATQADQRPLLIVLDVPHDPEAALAEEQLTPKGDKQELLTAYERCHVDVSTEYGKRVANAFGAKQFPFTAIIDKTGSVVLCKKAGKISAEEWNETLSKHQNGDRTVRAIPTSFIQDGSMSTGVQSPSYCPSCQRGQQGF